jgi:hypothetical protein
MAPAPSETGSEEMKITTHEHDNSYPWPGLAGKRGRDKASREPLKMKQVAGNISRSTAYGTEYRGDKENLTSFLFRTCAST